MPKRSAASHRSPREEVTLTDFDPDGEVKVVAAALYAGLGSSGRRSCWRWRAG